MKKIGVEITRLYVLEVDDDVDVNDWMEVGLVVADSKVAPEEVDLLAWELPDNGDINSEISAVRQELSRQRRVQDAIEMVAREYGQDGNRPVH